MDKELRTQYVDHYGEELVAFWMKEVEVDGVRSRWEDDKGYSTTYMQPMFELKDNLDAGQRWHWRPGFDFDEEAWLREGRIREKRFRFSL